jgi:hypothetical protein
VRFGIAAISEVSRSDELMRLRFGKSALVREHNCGTQTTVTRLRDGAEREAENVGTGPCAPPSQLIGSITDKSGRRSVSPLKQRESRSR